MRISIKMSVSRNDASETLSLDDLNLSQSEWENMTDSERETVLKEYVYDINDQPYWTLESFQTY